MRGLDLIGKAMKPATVLPLIAEIKLQGIYSDISFRESFKNLLVILQVFNGNFILKHKQFIT